MPTRHIFLLTDAQRAELSRAMRAHPKADLRERAATLLNIADGQSPHAVAMVGFSQPGQPDTVSAWRHR